MNTTDCAACQRTIDAAAKTCPYCGANPATGERVDTQAILEEVFHTREISTSESVLEYARQRQGVVIAVSVVVVFLVLAGVHQFVTARNAAAVTDAPAVPLTEITDVTETEEAELPLPELEYLYDGRPDAMRTYIVEQGAVPPPEVVAARQQEQQQQQMQRRQQQPPAAQSRPPAAQPQPPRPPQR